jgi:hypothetical protein
MAFGAVEQFTLQQGIDQHRLARTECARKNNLKGRRDRLLQRRSDSIIISIAELWYLR